jgi:type IV pilus assembly protein PilV
MTRPQHQASSRLQRGISLLESLVSLFILALGVLGLLSVQLRTMTETQTSSNRIVAARLADDLFERMKTNPSGWAAVAQYAVGWGNAPAAATNCASATCSPAQKAAWDLVQWKALVAATLPLGQALSFVSPIDARQLGVMIGWRANESNPTAAADYVAPFNANVVSGGATIAQCPANLICHVAYTQP